MKNYITDNIPLENRYITRSQNRANIPPIILITKINNLDNKIVKDKGNTYYTAFLAGSKPLEDPTTLAKALSQPVKEANE